MPNKVTRIEMDPGKHIPNFSNLILTYLQRLWEAAGPGYNKRATSSMHAYCNSLILSRPLVTPRLLINAPPAPYPLKCHGNAPGQVKSWFQAASLLDSDRLRQVTWEVHVQTLSNSKPISDELQGDDIQQALQGVDRLRHLDAFGLGRWEFWVVLVADNNRSSSSGNHYSLVSRNDRTLRPACLPC